MGKMNRRLENHLTFLCRLNTEQRQFFRTELKREWTAGLHSDSRNPKCTQEQNSILKCVCVFWRLHKFTVSSSSVSQSIICYWQSNKPHPPSFQSALTVKRETRWNSLHVKHGQHFMTLRVFFWIHHSKVNPCVRPVVSTKIIECARQQFAMVLQRLRKLHTEVLVLVLVCDTDKTVCLWIVLPRSRNSQSPASI